MAREALTWSIYWFLWGSEEMWIVESCELVWAGSCTPLNYGRDGKMVLEWEGGPRLGRAGEEESGRMEGGSEAHREAADPASQPRPRFLGSIHQMHVQAVQTAVLHKPLLFSHFLNFLNKENEQCQLVTMETLTRSWVSTPLYCPPDKAYSSHH